MFNKLSFLSLIKLYCSQISSIIAIFVFFKFKAKAHLYILILKFFIFFIFLLIFLLCLGLCILAFFIAFSGNKALYLFYAITEFQRDIIYTLTFGINLKPQILIDHFAAIFNLKPIF